MWDLSSLRWKHSLTHWTTREAPIEFLKVASSMVLQAKGHLQLWLRGRGVQLGQLGVHPWLRRFLSQTPEGTTSSL